MFTLVAWAAEVAHEAVPAAGGISAIGLDIKALLFQVINFAILLIVLRIFAYRPIVNLLQARRQKIEESLKNAEAIAVERATLTEERLRRIRAAEQEASEILSRSKQEGSNIIQSAQEKGRRQAAALAQEAAARAEAEAEQLRASIKHETLGLVKRATERLLRQKLDSQADTQLIKQAVKEVPSP